MTSMRRRRVIIRKPSAMFVAVSLVHVFVIGVVAPAHATQTIERGGLPGGDPPTPGIPITECLDGWYDTNSFGIPNTGPAQTYFTDTRAVNDLLGASAIAAIENAFSTWELGTNTCGIPSLSTYDFERADETTTPPSLFLAEGAHADNINEVAFVDATGIPGFLPTHVGMWAVERDPNNQAIVIDFDIVLDKSKPWTSSGLPTAYDIQAVVTQLVGSALGLIATDSMSHATMYWRTWPGDIGKRTLGYGDMNGLAVKSASRP